MDRLQIVILILALSSCKPYSIHQQNIIEQNKTMIKYDKKSRLKQQNIRDSRRKVQYNNKTKSPPNKIILK